MSERKHVTIYGDGACHGNPGPGGYGVVLLYDGYRREIAAGFRHTTNHRMELMAAIAGLQALKQPCDVTLYSDSKYLVDAMRKGWAIRWRDNQWQLRNKQAANPDLWAQLLDLCERHQVAFVWIKGHAGDQENERCDFLANEAARQPDAAIDKAFELQLQTQANTPTDRFVTASAHKMTEEGQPCRKCQTPIVKRIPTHQKHKPGQTYYFAYYFHCPGCDAFYMVEVAKRKIEPQPELFANQSKVDS